MCGHSYVHSWNVVWCGVVCCGVFWWAAVSLSVLQSNVWLSCIRILAHMLWRFFFVWRLNYFLKNGCGDNGGLCRSLCDTSDRLMLQCVAVCCRVLQCSVVCRSVLQYVAVCCSVLQCVAVCYSVLYCVAVWCNVLQCIAVCCGVLPCATVCCRVFSCVAVFCSVLRHDVTHMIHFANTDKCICIFMYTWIFTQEYK